ncbi:MAG: heparan-alpha-glucosaminide N-acetyltransferase domain-containing protein [Cytophagaceae bacterium]|jgi:uncharacterized membrane protein YeiB|nr:heparan-alpha-glucosaminide N-acetyltransferase domain-containing protein [Cytophagaceae bacterium]
MKFRVIGFDLARAYAIFGMFIVNFNTVFGSHTNHYGISGFLNMFNGNSSTLFVMLAGMGMSLMTNKQDYTKEEKKNIRRIISKRSLFLFIMGVVFYNWWPADILHFYGGYMHIAVLIVFLPKKYYLYTAAGVIILFHILLTVIPYETGWNFDTLMYNDFWTWNGFIRNTFYNGWNPIFPWLAYFLMGMYLGRLNWQNYTTPKYCLIISLPVYIMTFFIQTFATTITKDKDFIFYLTADYIPPFFPFMLSTASFGIILISIFIYIGHTIGESKVAMIVASTGQMTLTHYIAHLVFGIILLALITGKTLSYDLLKSAPTSPMVILLFSIFYYLFSCLFSYLWAKKYEHGPLEMMMRKVSN